VEPLRKDRESEETETQYEPRSQLSSLQLFIMQA
jgi:hypothetical protein